MIESNPYASFARWPLARCLALLLAAPGRPWPSHASPGSWSSAPACPTPATRSLSSATRGRPRLHAESAPDSHGARTPRAAIISATARRGWSSTRGRLGWVAASGRPWQRPTPDATNFAVGAARAYDDGVNFNLTRQVDTFLLRSGGVASPHALFVIEMGGNDIRDAFLLYATGGNGAPVLAAGAWIDCREHPEVVCGRGEGFPGLGRAERGADAGDSLARTSRPGSGGHRVARIQRRPLRCSSPSWRPLCPASVSPGSTRINS